MIIIPYIVDENLTKNVSDFSISVVKKGIIKEKAYILTNKNSALKAEFL